MNHIRNKKLCKLATLPLEEDQNGAQIIANPYLEMQQYVEMRDLIVCRLTLFNARKGGKPSRLFMTEWANALEETWINKDNNETRSFGQKTSKWITGTYQTGKGNQLVPILIPKDTFEPLRQLADMETRCIAGIAKQNQFVFASMSNSHFNLFGWHAVQPFLFAHGP